MVIVGLDLSTVCAGVAMLEFETDALLLCQEIKPKASWKTEDRALFISQHVREIVESSIDDIVLVAAEGIGTRFIQTAMGMGRVHQSVQEALATLLDVKPSLSYKTISPAELKKFATGKGNADKDAMIAAAKMKWDITDITDNEADAAFVALWGASIL